jgi:hypothetical protein
LGCLCNDFFGVFHCFFSGSPFGLGLDYLLYKGLGL